VAPEGAAPGVQVLANRMAPAVLRMTTPERSQVMRWTTAGAAALTLLVAGCGYTQGERVSGGAAVGAATGAGIGALAGPVGALAGAGVGGVAGGITGAVTSPEEVQLGRPPWTNPEARVPSLDDRRRVAASRDNWGTGAGATRGPAAASSPTVRQAQMDLQLAGFDPGPIDGVWGPRTARAVREFQQANNLPPTGQLDQPTMQALGAAGGGGPATGTGAPGAGSMAPRTR
jgi:hypothetical protein